MVVMPAVHYPQQSHTPWNDVESPYSLTRAPGRESCCTFHRWPQHDELLCAALAPDCQGLEDIDAANTKFDICVRVWLEIESV